MGNNMVQVTGMVYDDGAAGGIRRFSVSFGPRLRGGQFFTTQRFSTDHDRISHDSLLGLKLLLVGIEQLNCPHSGTQIYTPDISKI